MLPLLLPSLLSTTFPSAREPDAAIMLTEVVADECLKGGILEEPVCVIAAAGIIFFAQVGLPILRRENLVEGVTDYVRLRYRLQSLTSLSYLRSRFPLALLRRTQTLSLPTAPLAAEPWTVLSEELKMFLHLILKKSEVS